MKYKTSSRKEFLIIFSCSALGFFAFSLEKVFAMDWYVDNNASGLNSGISWSDAWESFDDIDWGVEGVKAGDTLYVSGGSSGKTYTTTFDTGANGTSELKITIQTGARSPSPSGHDGPVTIDTATGYGILVDNDYITVDGNDGNDSINLILTGNPLAGIILYDVTNALVTYVDSNANGSESGRGGLQTRGSVDACVVSYSDFYNNYDYGIYHDAIPPPVTSYEHLIVEHCNIYNNASDGLTAPRGVTLRYSYISTGTGSHRDGFECYGGGAGCGYVKIYGNDFGGSGNTMFWGDPEVAAGPVYIYNNYFYCDSSVTACNVEQAIKFSPDTNPETQGYYSGGEIYIYNNTIAFNTVYSGIEIGGKGGTFNIIDIRNNLIYETGGAAAGIALDEDVGTPTITIDYNVLSGSVYSGDRIFVKGVSYTCVDGSYSTYNTNGHCGEVSLQSMTVGTAGDPRPTENDTGLIDLGVSLSSLFTTDKIELARPNGPAWDIGAYEYTESSDTTPPSAPHGLSVQ